MLPPLSDLFDRVLLHEAAVVAFELNPADMQRWIGERGVSDEAKNYRQIPIRARLEGESCFRYMGKAGGFSYHALSKPLSSLASRR